MHTVEAEAEEDLLIMYVALLLKSCSKAQTLHYFVRIVRVEDNGQKRSAVLTTGSLAS